MDEVEEKALVAFDLYLGSLADDTQAVLDIVSDDAKPENVRRPLAGALNYLFKSLDLIDDGIEGLGFLDDAFVMRVACKKAAEASTLSEAGQVLASDAELVFDFLGDLRERFSAFVVSLQHGAVRGRSVDAILSDATVREDLAADVVSWASRYKKPQFVLDERGLIKLRAFLGAKLPA